ncbi:hypothetical protein K432DRAFT_336365 [Lepidopterella palustris CBS 459.81]|uniref:Amidohydrolase-related domain-containing protein n=1 Tax=Lepidopterella palustris CBS 459.81 TaxID=1314670 RepID=A0A8E2E2N3_9PEZI|nr:hypothetical protein K432DRAFT_336365 [Lepidopterella palustris CBS 459.81]
MSVIQQTSESSNSKMPHDDSIRGQILRNAREDGIDLEALPFFQAAISSIEALHETKHLTTSLPNLSGATRIDTHVHPVPDWYRDLAPEAAGRSTPKWDALSHLEFMDHNKIKHCIICISTPQANLYPGNPTLTAAAARILNEFVAVLVSSFPQRFSFQAVVPLPYIEAAIKEAEYALDKLGAVGIGVLTNHEGKYPGDESFKQFWQSLNARGSSHEIVFVHPTDPVIKVRGELVSSNPAPFRSGLGEFYFETARAISSLTASRTIHDFPALHWRISHGAGAFPCIADRFLLGFTDLQEEARKIYATRFWYDSAGPIYPRQIKGLLAYDIPISQLVFGTDYPYGIGFWDVNANIAGLADADFLSEEEKKAVFFQNVRTLYKGKIDDKKL